MSRRVARGFTLLELMIVVTIIAILASLAYFNYGRYAFRARRVDGREILMRVAAAEERYFTNFNVYTVDLTDPPTAGGLGFTNANSENGNYTVNVVLTNVNQGYVLAAVPQGVQVTDTCGTLTVTDTGVKLPAGTGTGNNGNCW